ncbi:MAG TPA: amino acid adenylation domain-containing protein [Thermoanaerobaculia bacterium]|nr:amino acid adenylation domain-containing protein [Thermoanaerobaculia bacterium]
MVVTEQRLLASLPPEARRVVCLDVEQAALSAESAARPRPLAGPQNLAYVIYTSGSTGRPKGVAISHVSASLLVQWAGETFGADELSGVLASTSLSFDLSVFELFVPLSWGGTVILAPNVLHLPALPAAARVRLINTVPSALAELVRAESLPPGVKTVNLAGEPLARGLAQQILASGTVERLWNLYGPSEDTTYSTAARVEPGERAPSIGRPIDGGQSWVVDGGLRPVPVGVAGELLLGGEGLARGYLSRPDLTAERFVPDPLGGEAGARLYRTGDRARWRRAGELEFLGRLDHQVKVRGFRIELGEIESVLSSAAGVRESVVLARPDGPGGPRLVAYVVPAAGEKPAATELRELLQQRLPDYMVPAVFVTLDSLPLTPNSKVDRRALPAPAGLHPAPGTAYLAPRTPGEEILASIWAEVLGVERVGLRDNFFELGGHSLLATQVISRVREAFGVELPVRELFEEPTVEGLAGRIERLRESAAPAPPIVPVPRGEGVLPPSFAQQRLWFVDRLKPGSSAYNVPLAARLTGALDAAALGSALREVACRHEVLRTTFAERDGRPVQVIAPEPRLPLDIVDLRGLPEAEREAEVARRAITETLRPFDLAAGPLIRAALLRLAEEEHALLVTMHHIVTDGWSMGIFLRELTELYGGRELPVLPVQYADFAVWQRSWMTGEVLESQLSYWRGHLAGAPARLTLPTDRPRPAVTTNHGTNQPVVLPPSLSRALSALARREGATPYMVLLAGFAALLGRYSGQRDVVVGSPIAGRNRRETEGLIGLFVNALALRVELAEGLDFLSLLRQARRTALDGFAHQDIPFERLVEELVSERDLGHSPLFQVTLALQNVPSSATAVSGLAIRGVAMESRTAKFEMSLRLVPVGDELAGGLEYNTDLFDAATAERLAGHLARLLELAVAAPEVPVPDLGLLAPAERQHLLREWNDTGMDYGAESGLCLHDLIGMQVERTLDAVAAVSGDEHLSYHELAQQAGRLARRLAAVGVGADSVVGICAERSLEMIVGLLGVLEAGGSYLPLDPSYPRERLATILESAGAEAVLIQEPLTDRLPEMSIPRLPLRPARDPVSWTPPAIRPENLAYVIFTSGSTGAPKGAMVSHQAIVNRLLWMQAAYGLSPADRVLQKTPFGFDVSVWEFFWPLLVGAPLVFARPEGHKDPAYLASLIAEQGITVLHFVPSMLRAFLETDRRESCRSVRAVMASGEALPFDLTERFFASMPGELHNLYGPTEAAVDVSFWPCVPGDDRRLVPIGRPIANLRLHVAERSWQPAPLGVAGELLIGGMGLGRGYLGRPDLTAERFVPDPFGSEAGGRLYRTGDLARHLPEGEIEFLGRLDFQVKIRGFRIELGEIEEALLAHDQIREAVVLVRPVAGSGEGSQERRLVAYVVSETGEEPADLRGFLGQRLPDYMVPPVVVVLPALPLSANGKIDRAALPAPEMANAVAEHVPPRTALERFLASGFRDVLALPPERPVGLHDDFFALGGHSITGAIFINRLQETLSEIVHVVTLFDHPTVASLAAYVTGQHPQAARRLWGEPATVESDVVAQVGPAEIEEMRRLVVTGRPEVPEEVQAPAPPNPPAVFVLSPPRSGSTLLRVMLGGHPGLFAPPELELLSFPTLSQRRQAFQGRDSFWLEGVVRAVMEARGCGAEEAERLIAGYEDGGWSTRRFYGELQSWLGERLLVDKTPSYALDPEVLARAESWFTAPRYIHLMRDPRATNLSFEEAKLDQIFFRRPHRFTRHQLAELFWTVCHRNILDFLSALPRERWLPVRFEELVREPERVLSGICDFLGIDYRPEMADPYREGRRKGRRSRMTDGVHDVSRMLGDVKFHTHSRVDSSAAERWRQAEEVPLGTPARELALELGYADAVPELVAQTDILVRLQAGAPEVRPLFCVHPVGGDVACYRELARRLGPDQPVFGLRSPQEPIPDLRQMATLYVEVARQAQPAGPYRLAGWSMGGLVAYEMARQLEEQGEAVELVALIDAASPQWWAEQTPSSDGELVAWFARDLARLFGAAQVPAVRLDAPDVDGNLARVLEAGHATGLVAAGVGLADLRRLFEVFRANRIALSSYPPLPYSGALELIRAAETGGEEGEDPYRGWSGLAAGGVTVHTVQGDHYSIVLGEGVERLTGLLRSWLSGPKDGELSHG